jgi:hypothetical protein
MIGETILAQERFHSVRQPKHLERNVGIDGIRQNHAESFENNVWGFISPHGINGNLHGQGVSV